MKIKSFLIKTPQVKRRGHNPPPTRKHKDKRNDYNRRDFKNYSDGYEL